mmetsp:Transcript_59917/g.117813  ORF Transcript_59917/g.117813 Transcript_59917/m.117813 type:complete len:358 (-) Transcript_59917:32-1105(-)
MSSLWLSWLLCLCSVQFLIILNLLSKQYGGHHSQASTFSPVDLKRSKSCNLGSLSSQVVLSECQHMAKSKTPPKGVAATLLLHAPTWFQRRYTMMIQNTVNNIPEDWVVQIFYTESGQSKHGIDINPGIKRFIRTGKVILTPIPSSVLTVKKKRFELMFEPWIWESMLADTVLIFGGNAVICSNSPYSFADFTEFDYIGSPWDFKKGVGGDGGISIRNRRAMLAAIDHALTGVDDMNKRLTAFRSWGQEDQFFVRTLIEMNKQASPAKPRWHIAERNDTLRFSGIGSAVNEAVLVVSGTLPSVSYDDRQSFMNHCPEIKMFYPALHDPHCFGAQPNAELCAKSICALKSKKERRGGC